MTELLIHFRICSMTSDSWPQPMRQYEVFQFSLSFIIWTVGISLDKIRV